VGGTSLWRAPNNRPSRRSAPIARGPSPSAALAAPSHSAAPTPSPAATAGGTAARSTQSATPTTTSFAGLALSVVSWLLVGGTLVLHHPFDPKVVAAQCRDERCDTLIVPGPLVMRLAEANLQKLKDAASPDAAARAQIAENLKQLGIGLHNYHDTYTILPTAAIYGKDGKALLSWRVAILPFIEHDDLYKQFKLDEPWDSEHNKKLIEKMPRTFAPAGSQAEKDHETHYQGFVGKTRSSTARRACDSRRTSPTARRTRSCS